MKDKELVLDILKQMYCCSSRPVYIDEALERAWEQKKYLERNWGKR
jgi:hypothetical protein